MKYLILIVGGLLGAAALFLLVSLGVWMLILAQIPGLPGTMAMGAFLLVVAAVLVVGALIGGLVKTALP